MVRAPFYDENGVKRGAWSEEEDDRLRDYIQKFGHSNWRELPKFAGLSRCGKSCRLRWVNYLKPNLKKGNYTKEEEDTIIKLHDDFGNKWSVIAAQLQGRTDNEIKNYWHTHLKNRRQKNKNTKNENQNSDSASEHESDKGRGSESDAESMFASIPPNHILESSPFYPETSYPQTSQCSPLSPATSSGTNSLHVPVMEQVPEETIVTSLDSYGQSSGDFWTEPFIPDNSYFPNYESPLAFTDGEYLSQYVSYIGDTSDLLYQAIQELPEDSAYIPPSYL